MNKIILTFIVICFLLVGIISLVQSSDLLTTTWNKVTTTVGSFFIKTSIDGTGTEKIEGYLFEVNEFAKLPTDKEGNKYFTINDIQKMMDTYNKEKPLPVPTTDPTK